MVGWVCSSPAPCLTTVTLLTGAWKLCHCLGPLSPARNPECGWCCECGFASVLVAFLCWLGVAGGPRGGCGVQLLLPLLELGLLQELPAAGTTRIHPALLSSPVPAECRMEMCRGLPTWEWMGWRSPAQPVPEDPRPFSPGIASWLSLDCFASRCTSAFPSAASWKMEAWTQPPKNGANPPKAAARGS